MNVYVRVCVVVVVVVVFRIIINNWRIYAWYVVGKWMQARKQTLGALVGTHPHTKHWNQMEEKKHLSLSLKTKSIQNKRKEKENNSEQVKEREREREREKMKEKDMHKFR